MLAINHTWKSLNNNNNYTELFVEYIAIITNNGKLFFFIFYTLNLNLIKLNSHKNKNLLLISVKQHNEQHATDIHQIYS